MNPERAIPSTSKRNPEEESRGEIQSIPDESKGDPRKEQSEGDPKEGFSWFQNLT